MSKAKSVYVGMCADIFHVGHLNIIEHAKSLGEVTVGLFTDRAVAEYKRVPMIKFEHRKRILETVNGVASVIPQDSLDYTGNLRNLRPDFVLHGDDWRIGPLSGARQRVLDVLAEWGGQLVEVPYTEGVSSSSLQEQVRSRGFSPEDRKARLRRMLECKPLVRLLEAHSGLSGMIVDSTKIVSGTEVREFDGIWISSLTNSFIKGKPDAEVVSITAKLFTLMDILDSTKKPIVFDGDSGGYADQFREVVRTLDRIGVSAVVIEDKTGPKQNSLSPGGARQSQASIKEFCKKIESGCESRLSNDFLVIARIESLILGKGEEDALERAGEYIKAGSDAILIHSRRKDPSEIVSFCREYKNRGLSRPLIAVPSTYSSTYESELVKEGISVVIYANQLLRSSYSAMFETARSILLEGRSWEREDHMISVTDMLQLIQQG